MITKTNRPLKPARVYTLTRPAPQQGLSCDPNTPEGKSLTQQNFGPEVDINFIVAKARKTGGFPPLRTDGFYGDVSDVGDYRQALEKLDEAKQDFNALPSNIRFRFKNDPGQLLDFIHNPANRQEAIALGLINPPPTPPTGGDTKTDKDPHSK